MTNIIIIVFSILWYLVGSIGGMIIHKKYKELRFLDYLFIFTIGGLSGIFNVIFGLAYLKLLRAARGKEPEKISDLPLITIPNANDQIQIPNFTPEKKSEPIIIKPKPPIPMDRVTITFSGHPLKASIMLEIQKQLLFGGYTAEISLPEGVEEKHFLAQHGNELIKSKARDIRITLVEQEDAK